MHIYKIAMLGDKDHGKSTIIGSMLMLTKSVSENRISEAKRISMELGRPFEPGFILDSFSEERANAMTIDTTRAQMRYKGIGFEFIDVPGHEELITNMLTGASSAGTAVLIVSVKKGEGISSQTKRHMLLGRMLGISRIVVAVNKMDTVGYSKEAFERVKMPLRAFISNASTSIGAINADFVPVSAYNGENLITRSKNIGWYRGMPLAELLSGFATERKGKARTGFRALVQGVLGRDQVACKIISGTLRKGSTVAALPGNAKFIVEKIIKAGKSVPSAGSGSSPLLELSNNGTVERGGILSALGSRPRIGKSAEALVFLVKKPRAPKITLGTQEARCSLSIERAIDISSGSLEAASAVKPMGIYMAKINFAKAIAYERFDELMELGRFTLHEKGAFVGLGVIV